MTTFHSKQFGNLLKVIVLTVFLLAPVFNHGAQAQDTALFGFEGGELHDFNGGGIVNDSYNTYAGTGAAKVKPTIATEDKFYGDVSRWVPTGIPAGAIIDLHVYVPTGTEASFIVYTWAANWSSYSAMRFDFTSIQPDTWTRLSFELPSGFETPLEVLGIQIYASAPGDIWIDSIGYRLQPQETDTDGDGVFDTEDNCPEVANADQADKDGDAIGDLCDDDSDNDGVADQDDNCALAANPNQTDTDGDGKGDVCDEDVDGDQVLNELDNCMLDTNADQADFDGDQVGDACDDDSDGDAVVDATDACLETPAGVPVGNDGCSIAQTCPVENNWKNHRAYVRCVAKTASKFVAAGLITERERKAAVHSAIRTHIKKVKDKNKCTRKPKSLRSHKFEWKHKRHSKSEKHDYPTYSSRFKKN